MPRYKIESAGNDLFWTITRIADGAVAFVQGEYAVDFGHSLDLTHDFYGEDDVCDEYADLLELPVGPGFPACFEREDA